MEHRFTPPIFFLEGEHTFAFYPRGQSFYALYYQGTKNTPAHTFITFCRPEKVNYDTVLFWKRQLIKGI